MYADGADGVSTYNMNPGNYANPMVYPPSRDLTIGGRFYRGCPTCGRIVAELMERLGDPRALRDLKLR